MAKSIGPAKIKQYSLAADPMPVLHHRQHLHCRALRPIRTWPPSKQWRRCCGAWMRAARQE